MLKIGYGEMNETLKLVKGDLTSMNQKMDSDFIDYLIDLANDLISMVGINFEDSGDYFYEVTKPEEFENGFNYLVHEYLKVKLK